MKDFYSLKHQMENLCCGDMALESLALAEDDYLLNGAEPLPPSEEDLCWDQAVVPNSVKIDGVWYKEYRGDVELYRTHNRSEGTFHPVWQKNSYWVHDGKLIECPEEFYGDLLKHYEIMYVKEAQE